MEEKIKALLDLDETIRLRRENPQEGSYTCYLFDKGIDKILKKCGEENAEMIIAAKNQDKAELANEVSDLIFHILVMLQACDTPLEDVLDILHERSMKTGNLKKFHQVDRNS